MTSIYLKGHGDCLSKVAVSLDGKYVITGSVDKTARVWDLETGETVRVLKGHTYPVEVVALSADNKYVVTGSVDEVRVWDIETGETARVLKGHTYGIYAVAVSPDGKYVVTGSSDNTARVWDIETGETVKVLEGHTCYVRAVAVSADGKYVVTGSGDRTARVWNLETGETVRILQGHTLLVSAVAVSPDGKYVVTGSWDCTARVWNSEASGSVGSAGSTVNRETVRVLKGHTVSVHSVAVSQNGKYVVTSSGDHTTRLWDLETETVRVQKHPGQVFLVSMLLNNKYIAIEYWNDYRSAYLDDNYKNAKVTIIDPLLDSEPKTEPRVQINPTKSQLKQLINFANTFEYVIAKEMPISEQLKYVTEILVQHKQTCEYDREADACIGVMDNFNEISKHLKAVTELFQNIEDSIKTYKDKLRN